MQIVDGKWSQTQIVKVWKSNTPVSDGSMGKSLPLTIYFYIAVVDIKE